MVIYINDKAYEARPGDLLLDVAKKNKAHIGYICGGGGICQSCFVYVREGMDCLSEKSSVENAFISDKLQEAGGRLACQTKIVKEGNIRLLSRAEQLRRIVLGLNIPGFISYAQTIGYNVFNQLPSGVGNIVSRVQEGKIDPGRSLQNIAMGIGPAALLAGNTIMENFSFLEGPVTLVSNGAKGVVDAASDTVCQISGGRLHLPGASCKTCEEAPVIERVQITTGKTLQ